MLRIASELKRSQFLPFESVAAEHDRKVQSALRRAYETVPYYRESWPAPKSSGTPRFEIDLLPLLSKPELQENFIRLRANPLPRRLTSKTTGGSTGQAVSLLKDRGALAREMAATALAYSWFGVQLSDRHARFWGAPTTFKRRVRMAAVSLVTRRKNLSAFAFDREDLEGYWQSLRRYKPAYLYGYVSMLEEFARHLSDAGHDGRQLNLKSVITTSEVLSTPQRQLLGDVFGVPVQNEYGCGEVGPIAYDCEFGTLHVMAENLLVEVLREDGSAADIGETGEVVVSDLHNRAMPLIRYRVGDFAVRGGPCQCGRWWPSLERVWGRAYDFIEDAGGRRYHGEFLMYLFEDLRDRGRPISQFQVRQTEASRLDVSIVAKGALEQAITDDVMRAFSERLPTFTVSVRAVPSIERAPSGKLQIIKNAR